MSHQSSGQYRECGKPSIKSSCDTSDREGNGGPGGGREAAALCGYHIGRLDTFLAHADDSLDACLRHMVLDSGGYSKIQVYIVSSELFVMNLKWRRCHEWFYALVWNCFFVA